ncbi:MAG TPA: type II toxin-antitoxin system VapC family toxin [Longimicrobium sp.]|nr:type II toxin-antitoxin system VapC family toxin [Longimicrobium sp.]
MPNPKPRVYVETTIPSAYYTGRKNPEAATLSRTTRRWWDKAVTSCELVTSRAVLDELAQGRSDYVEWRLALLEGLPVLEADETVRATARIYIQQKLMPADPLGDALHLALASHDECDLLVTWNYRHLANRTKLERIRRVNRELGLFIPVIVSPGILLGGDV